MILVAPDPELCVDDAPLPYDFAIEALCIPAVRIPTVKYVSIVRGLSELAARRSLATN